MKSKALTVSAAFLILSCTESELGEPPDANLEANPRSTNLGQKVDFSIIEYDTATKYTIQKYAWDFDGDGRYDTTTDRNTPRATWTYQKTGKYMPRAAIRFNENGAVHFCYLRSRENPYRFDSLEVK